MSQPRRIVVTGVTSGLGRALVGGFLSAGHVVFGCGKDTAKVQRATVELPGARIAVVDVADDGAVAAWAETVLATGPPDLLVNNAALMNQPAPLWQVPAGEFDRLIDVNVKGVANVIRRFVPAMAAAGRGVIVNLSSGWGRSVDAEVAPYCTSKWAIEGMTRALAAELPTGLAAVPLNPGVIDTPMLRTCWGASAGNYPRSDDWARRAVPFLLGLGPKDNGRPLTVPGA